jgi:hypothetical protein
VTGSPQLWILFDGLIYKLKEIKEMENGKYTVLVKKNCEKFLNVPEH